MLAKLFQYSNTGICTQWKVEKGLHIYYHDKPNKERLATLQLLAHGCQRGGMCVQDYQIAISIQIFPLYIPTLIPPLQGDISLSFSSIKNILIG